MLGEYSHTKSESLAKIRTIPWLKYSIFARGLFFIGPPCIIGWSCQNLSFVFLKVLTVADITTQLGRLSQILMPY